MKKDPVIPDVTTAGLKTVALRCPNHPVALALIREARVPVAAPSGNLSGRPSPTTAAHMYADMAGRIPLILDGGACRVGVESTVIDARTEPVRILRPGGVTPQMICDVLGEVEVDGSVLRPLSPGEVVRSPGMKYRHYAPEGKLTIVKGEAESVASKICALYDEAQGLRCILAKEEHLSLYGNRDVRSLGSNAAQAASRLFDLLRLMDDEGMSAIFSEALDAQEMGLAVMNRLGRAAAFNIIEA
jgi:L-threonylcarbamoyladenylate synthase